MKSTTRLQGFGLFTATALSAATFLLAQGPLTPPGAPAPTMKTLQQVEPRIDLNALPGSASAVVTITQPGAYYATANLAGATGKHTIEVSASGVTIDLNGFALIGTATTHSAIMTATFNNLTVKNGRLTGGAYGIRTTSRLTCVDLSVDGGSLAGISAGAESRLERCVVTNAGIQIASLSQVTDCESTGTLTVGQGSIVTRNRVSGGGIVAVDNCQIVDCVVQGAPGTAIRTGAGGIVSGCTVDTTVRSGIVTGNQARVSRCTVTAASSSGAAGDAGISLGTSCHAESCTVDSSTMPGIVASTDARLSDCTATGNGGTGISAADRSTLSGCTASANEAGGINVTGVSGIVERCTASANTGGSGIRVESATVRDCEARGNQGGPGIRVSSGSTVEHNNSTANGTAALPQHGYLIEGGRSRVEGNHAYNNTGNGFNVTNTSSTNSVLIIGNSAGSNDLGEYSIGAGNAAGPIISPSATATNTIPTANFNL